MTVIEDFAVELLSQIFGNLEIDDLKEAQKVCRTWYPPAHAPFLKIVGLGSTLELKQFMGSIDAYPDPSYLNAVNELYISTLQRPYDGFQFDKAAIKKMFMRFPNLKTVNLVMHPESFDQFDDEDCKNIWKSCTKLDEFEIATGNIVDEDDEDAYLEFICKMRYLITSINTDDVDFRLRFDSMQEFITSFPQLRRLKGTSETVDTFQKYMPIFEQVPHLKSIKLHQNEDDTEEYFAERYITAKAESKQKQIVKTVTHLETLDWVGYEGMCVNSMLFMERFLVGLNKISLYSLINNEWTETQRKFFCDIVMPLVTSAKECGHLIFYLIKFKHLTESFDGIVHALFHSLTEAEYDASHKVLQLNFRHRMVDANLTDLILHLTPREKYIDITFHHAITPNQVMTNLFVHCTPFFDIDELIIEIGNRGEYRLPMECYTYDNMLRVMRLLKKLMIDIPASFEDQEPAMHYSYDQHFMDFRYSTVEEVTLRPIGDVYIQQILNRYCNMFPDMKRLNLFYYCGNWEPDISEFLVRLPKYTLDNLAIDVTPVKAKMKKYLKKKCTERDFIVIELEILRTGERRLYKMAANRVASLKPLKFADLRGQILGRDYFRVRIMVRSLKSLLIYMVSNPGDQTYLHCRNPNVPHININLAPKKKN